MSKKNKGLSGTSNMGIIEQYNNLPPDAAKTKLIRSGVELGSAALGGFLASVVGKHAPILGAGMIVTGNIFGDKSGISRTMGTGMFIYGLAKIFENKDKSTGQESNVKTRTVQFKDELLASFYLDKLVNKNTVEGLEMVGEPEEVGEVGSLDLASLDIFEEFNEQEADEFDMQRQSKIEALPETTTNRSVDSYLNDQNRDFSYALLDDGDDLPEF